MALIVLAILLSIFVGGIIILIKLIPAQIRDSKRLREQEEAQSDEECAGRRGRSIEGERGKEGQEG